MYSCGLFFGKSADAPTEQVLRCTTGDVHATELVCTGGDILHIYVLTMLNGMYAHLSLPRIGGSIAESRIAVNTRPIAAGSSIAVPVQIRSTNSAYPGN